MEHDPAGERLRIRETRPGCLVATIDNPPINLLDPDLYAELWALLVRMERDDSLRVVVFESANPDYFIAHLDARRIGEAPKRPGVVPVEQTWPEFVERFARTPAVSIGSIRGRARGVGVEFALACDMRFASAERALFGLPEVGFGVIPAGGGLAWLPRIVGRARALEIVLTAHDYDAPTAERYGLVNRAVADADLDAAVLAIAERIAGFPRAAIAATKRILNEGGAPPDRTEVASGLQALGEIRDGESARRMSAMLAAGWGTDSPIERDQMAVLPRFADPDFDPGQLQR